MGGDGRRSRVEPTDEWEQLALLCRWPEQRAYEEIRPLTLFGASVSRARSRDGLRRAYTLPQARPLRVGGHGEPIRCGDGAPPQATARDEAPGRRPEGGVPRL